MRSPVLLLDVSVEGRVGQVVLPTAAFITTLAGVVLGPSLSFSSGLTGARVVLFLRRLIIVVGIQFFVRICIAHARKIMATIDFI